MIHAARLLGLVSACAVPLLAGALVEPASAQGDACKADIVTAQTSKRVVPVGEEEARRSAIANWERQAASSFGERWKSWSKAKDTTSDCERIKGKIAFTYMRCTVTGRPCAAAGAANVGTTVVEEDKGPGKGPGKRLRDNGPPIVVKDRPARYEDWAYQREMERQRHMEAERKRIETAAYEREMARQRYLAEKRSKDEAISWERENARQRYLDRQQDWYDRAYTRGRYWTDY
jgi:hypothetical protein